MIYRPAWRSLLQSSAKTLNAPIFVFASRVLTLQSQTKEGALTKCKADGVKYFMEKFQRLPLKFRQDVEEPPKEVFTHVTTAINTDNARKVLAICQETILMKALQDTGFYS